MSDTHETLAAKQAITEVSTGTADEYVDRVLTAHSHASALSHQLTNVLIDVDVASDRATSVSYVTALVRMPGTDHVARTQYHDTWSRRDDVWAIDTRRALLPIVQAIPNDDAAS